MKPEVVFFENRKDMQTVCETHIIIKIIIVSVIIIKMKQHLIKIKIK